MTVFSTKTPATLLASLVMFAMSVTAQQVVLDDVPYNTPMWSQADPFGFAELRGLTNDIDGINNQLVAVTNDIVKLGAEIPNYLRNLPAVTNWSFATPEQKAKFSTDEIEFYDVLTGIATKMSRRGLGITNNDNVDVRFNLMGMYINGTLYPYPTGDASGIATIKDVETYVDQHGGDVASVNGQTGVVVITAASLGALTSAPPQSVVSVNSKTGVVVLTAADVGAATTQSVTAVASRVGHLEAQTNSYVRTVGKNTVDVNWGVELEEGLYYMSLSRYGLEITDGSRKSGLHPYALRIFRSNESNENYSLSYLGVTSDDGGSETIYPWPSGPSSTIATLHDITNAIPRPDLSNHMVKDGENPVSAHNWEITATEDSEGRTFRFTPYGIYMEDYYYEFSMRTSHIQIRDTGSGESSSLSPTQLTTQNIALWDLEDRSALLTPTGMSSSREPGAHYPYPSGPSSPLATLHDITNAIDQIDFTEHDPAYWREYYYGDASIMPSPTNWFSFTAVDGGAAWAVSGFDYQSGREDVVVPYEFYGKPITEIGTVAFQRGVIAAVQGSRNLKVVGNYAFDSCYNLTSINLPSATTIDDSAFYGCDSLTSVNLPQAASIGDYAFDYCGALTSITIGSATKPTFGTGWNQDTNPDLKIYVTNPYATGWDGVTSVNGTPVVRIVNTEMLEDLIPDVDTAIGTATNAVVTTLTNPYQPWTATITPVSGTATVTRAHGLYPKLVLTGKTTISIDSDTYPTEGTSAVKLSLFAGANEVELDETNVMYAEPIEISDTEWTTIYFERTGNSAWRAVTW